MRRGAACNSAAAGSVARLIACLFEGGHVSFFQNYTAKEKKKKKSSGVFLGQKATAGLRYNFSL
jgi:hypothetical protein